MGFRVLDGIKKIGDGTFSGCAELTSITGWKSDGEIERRFDERNGRLVIKGRGPLEDYADGSKSSRMKDYPIDI